MSTPESRQAAARRAARTRAERAARGAYGDRRTAAQVRDEQSARGGATLDDLMGSSIQTFGPRAKAHRDAAGRAYRVVQDDTYVFVLPVSRGKKRELYAPIEPPVPGEVIELEAPDGSRWKARVLEVSMDLKRRKCSGMVELKTL